MMAMDGLCFLLAHKTRFEVVGAQRGAASLTIAVADALIWVSAIPMDGLLSVLRRAFTS